MDKKIIENIYNKRKNIPKYIYSKFSADVIFSFQERQRILISLLKLHGIDDLSKLKILEIGCGNGSNLIEFILLGAEPKNLVGNELLQERFLKAKSLLPSDVQLYFGDVCDLELKENSFDIVMQSTVFTSILEQNLQQLIAQKMWGWVRPGGGVLWYDFTFNNPKNPDVRGVSISRIRSLFPSGEMAYRRCTLAPPLSRFVTKFNPLLYDVFNFFPWLRTHVLCYIKKS